MNGLLANLGKALLTVMATGALITSLNVWRDAANHANRLEIEEKLNSRDHAHAAIFAKMGQDLARLETKIDFLIREEERRRNLEPKK